MPPEALMLSVMRSSHSVVHEVIVAVAICNWPMEETKDVSPFEV